MAEEIVRGTTVERNYQLTGASLGPPGVGTQATVVAEMVPAAGGDTLERAMAVLEALDVNGNVTNKGIVRGALAADLTTPPGVYRVRFHVTHPDASEEYFPSSGHAFSLVVLHEPVSASSPPPGGSTNFKIAATVAGLGVGAGDGAPGALRVGAWPNKYLERLNWDAAEGRWVGEEHDVVTQGDVWAMDLRDKSGAQLVDWAPLVEAVPYGGSMAILNGAHDLSAAAFGNGTGVVKVNSIHPPAGHAERPFVEPSGNVRIRDNYIAYTGVATDAPGGGPRFTGCTRLAGSGGVMPGGIIVSQGRPGGFGWVVSPVMFAAELYAAGLRLQEKLLSQMNGSPEAAPPGTKALSLAPYWLQYNDGDGSISAAAPPSGGIGLGAVLVGTTDPNGVIEGERSFTLADNGWSDWALGPITKRYLVPKMYGKMSAGAIDTGQCLDTVLRVRWVSP